MKYAVLFIALALCVISVSPVAAVPPQYQPNTIQIASGTMTGTTMSVQSVQNVAVHSRHVEQYAVGTMKLTTMSTQTVGNKAFFTRSAQQGASATMKRAFLSIQDVQNAVYG